MIPKLIVWAILLCGSPLFSIAQPTLIRWDTTQAFPSLNEAIRQMNVSNREMLTWLNQDYEKRKPLYDSLIFFNLDDYVIPFYKTLLRDKKDQKSLLDFGYMLHLSHMIQKDRLEYLFNQYPLALRNSAEGKKIQASIRREGEHEGRNISKLLSSTRMISLSGKEAAVETVLDGRRLYILVFGASWCQPCKYQDRLLHQAAAAWDPSRFKIVHLSIDTDRKKWEAGYKGVASAYLLQGARDAALVKSLNIPGVPRFLVVDEKGLVVMDNAGGVRVLIKKLEGRLRWDDTALVNLAMLWCESVY